MLKHVTAGVLEVAYEEAGTADSAPAFLLHGFPYDVVPGDPAVEKTEERLAARPPITVPTVVLHGGDNAVSPARSSEQHARFFTGRYERRLIPRLGHNVPQEAPREFADAVLALI